MIRSLQLPKLTRFHVPIGVDSTSADGEERLSQGVLNLQDVARVRSFAFLANDGQKTALLFRKRRKSVEGGGEKQTVIESVGSRGGGGGGYGG